MSAEPLHRVRIAKRSFNIQEARGRNKDGSRSWTTIEYHTNRRDLLQGLVRQGLPLELADDVPKFHTNTITALEAHTRPRPVMSMASVRAFRKQQGKARASKS